jgi:hypothetical protein
MFKQFKIKTMKNKNLLMTAIAILGFATVTMAQHQLSWGTYYTGIGQVWPFGEDRGSSCITDASGNVYMVGFTSSITDIATAGAHQSVHAGGPTVGGNAGLDAYLVKFNSNGVRQWATYYGGSENDKGISCAIDASGNVYMLGSTSSTSGIATPGTHQSAYGGINESFLAKFNSSGVLQWGTYCAGIGNACTTDASGNVYIVGSTTLTTGIATAGAHQTVLMGGGDAFLVKFNSSGEKQWGTYYGGSYVPGASNFEEALSCATDALGNIYMVGRTQNTPGFTSAGAHQTIYGGGSFDAFLVKFNSSGVHQWGTYYGGGATETGYSCATDASGNVYMVGDVQQAGSALFGGIATTGSHQSAYGGGYNDAFLVKFDSNGIRQWGTYYGGTGIDNAFSCATDASGNVYMSGDTQSSSGIATPGAHQTIYGSATYGNALLVSFNSSGLRQWGTYYTGIRNICTTDISGNIYMAGYTASNYGVATAGAHQSVGGSGGSYNDAFLVKFNALGLGFNENINENLFSVYPNPAQSTVNVKSDIKLIGSVYDIYDNMGKVVLSGTINAENTSVDLRNLSAGIYLFSAGENLKQTFKVIKE